MNPYDVRRNLDYIDHMSTYRPTNQSLYEMAGTVIKLRAGGISKDVMRRIQRAEAVKHDDVIKYPATHPDSPVALY